MKCWADSKRGASQERALESDVEEALAGVAELIGRQPDLGVGGVRRGAAAGTLGRFERHGERGVRVPNQSRDQRRLIVGLFVTRGSLAFREKAEKE